MATRKSLSDIKDMLQKTDAFDKIASGSVTARPYKVYTALLTQTGTAAPVATILENQLSGPIVWARAGVGVYTGTLSAAFTANKTTVSISQPATGKANIVRTSANVLTVNTFDATPAAADAILSGMLVEVRVYN